MTESNVSAERLKHLLDNPEHINPRYELSAIITLALEALALRTPSDGAAEPVACRWRKLGDKDWSASASNITVYTDEYEVQPLYVRPQAEWAEKPAAVIYGENCQFHGNGAPVSVEDGVAIFRLDGWSISFNQGHDSEERAALTALVKELDAAMAGEIPSSGAWWRDCGAIKARLLSALTGKE